MRFMTTSLSKLVDNLVKAIYKIKCKDCDCFLEYDSAKDDLINERCLSCNKDYSKKLNEELKNKFKNTFKFSNNYVNEFILLLRKGIYPYEHVDDWEKFNETTLPEKKFDSNLNMKDITDADYTHGKRVCKGFQTKNFGEYHDLYLKSDILLFACFLEFQKNVFKNLSIRSCKISFDSWISMASSFIKNWSKIGIINQC